MSPKNSLLNNKLALDYKEKYEDNDKLLKNTDSQIYSYENKLKEVTNNY